MYYLFRYIPAFFNIHILFLVKIMDNPIWNLCFVFIWKLFGPKLQIYSLSCSQGSFNSKSFQLRSWTFLKLLFGQVPLSFHVYSNLLSSHSFFVSTSIKLKMVLLLCVNKETNWSNLFYCNANYWLLYKLWTNPKLFLKTMPK